MGAGLHRRTTDGRFRWRAPGVVTGLVLVVALGGFGTAIALQRDSHSSAGGGGSDPSNNGGSSTTTTTLPPAPLRITAVSPTPGSTTASFDTMITVNFSQPLASNSPLPSVSPAPPGRWVRVGPKTVRFVPRGFFAPYSKVQVSVPGGPTGVRSRYGQRLAATLQNHFAIQGGSELRLQQLLAELLYLPVRFVPALRPAKTTGTGSSATVRQAASSTTTTTTPPPPPPAIDSEPSVAAEVPVQAAAGHFVWRFGNTPASLATLWKPGQPNVITTGAVMAFESAKGLTTDGVAGPKVWTALLEAVARRQVTTQPYDYVIVSQDLPETASVWRNGKIIFSPTVNTGISVAPTALGTYPVYARYLVTTMSGKNPNGTPYSDPGIPDVSYFNGGDALHGFLRASYGFPQSLGCVEMTYADAAIMFPLTPLGTLVTVL
jgi:peptidoglycan hydrolase-like protein with peptidoglycan-binding domain